ncbi:MAG: aminotransferase class I/II-fold pyridoxal phosphate-dependent enzyme [Planctomycetes bacterium]|nr:aminotransferase class I/II-fold pyridoxal phosphate-dependent enzyme [Planctomycetota bacterium]
MTFRRIEYLEWARTHMGRVKIDLAKSNIKALSPQELGLSLDAVQLISPNEDGVVELRELLAKRYGVPRANVLVTSGATMGLYLACGAVVGDGGQVLLESPNYEPLYRVLEERGAEIKMLERRFERGWQIELEELERRAGRSTKAIVLTNTHNPSGAATSPEKMMTIGQIARENGATVIVSEVLALDYIECDLPAPSESIALAALRKGPELVLRCQQIAMRNFKIIGEWIQKRGDLQWVEPGGGTVCMVKLPPQVDAQALSTLLREKYGTLVVPGDFFWVRGFIRLSAGMDEEVLRQGLKNVGKAIDQLQNEGS